MNEKLQDSLVLTLNVTDPSLDEEEREALAQSLYRQLRSAEDNLGETRRPQAVAPAGAKSAGAAILGALTVILSAGSLKSFFAYLTERLRGREITVEMAIDGRQAKLTARTAEDLVVAYHTAAALMTERR